MLTLTQWPMNHPMVETDRTEHSRKKPHALVCPLDWGIGHATRCVPIIRSLQEAGFHVTAAADTRPLEFLKKECSGIDFIVFPGTKIRYPKNGQIALKMICLLPEFLYGILREHKKLAEIAGWLHPDLIISDNRYGCWHPDIPSVFITHQLDVEPPALLKWMRGILRSINYWFIRRYLECWIPDFELHKGIAGTLSHPLIRPANIQYIGILSRFSYFTDRSFKPTGTIIDLVALLSGPEPQRTILEKKLLADLQKLELKAVVVQGKTETSESFAVNERIHCFSHLGTQELARLLHNTDLVICRSGYSSIMDLVTLGKRAVFIPTPGQTEQEYLARYLMDKKIYFSMKQDHFDLVYAMEMAKNFPGMMIPNDYSTLKERIRELSAALFPHSPAYEKQPGYDER